MLHSETYLGLPNEIWNDLISETEDTLREEGIGTHILGVYPSGGRIFGIESTSPQFICLYIDEPTILLNPTAHTTYRGPNNDHGGFKYFNLKLDGSSVIYIELYSWIQWIIYGGTSTIPHRYLQLLDLIPCHQDIAYQDQSIDDLINYTRKYLSTGGWNVTSSFRREAYQIRDYENLVQQALYYRTALLFQKTKKLVTNMNDRWNSIQSLEDFTSSKITIGIDEEIQRYIKENERIPLQILKKYTCDLESLVSYKREFYDDKLEKKMGLEVAKIYKFIL